MKNKGNVLNSLIIMPVAEVIYFPAQQLISRILPEQHPTIFSVFGKLTIKGLTEAVQRSGSGRLNERKGNLWLATRDSVFIITMGNPFNILQPGRDLSIVRLCLFMKIEPAIFGSVHR